MGRPTKLTEETAARIVTLIRNGNFRETAARASGVGVATFYEWMARGQGTHPERPTTPQYAEFAEAVERAEAEAEATGIALIEVAARNGQWQAEAWRLERMWPHKFSRRTIVEGGDKPITLAAVDLRQMDDGQLNALTQTLEAAGPPLIEADGGNGAGP